MSKSSTSFLHYAGARNDEKILKLRAKFGVEGYGLYFMLLEMLREADNQELSLEYSYLGFALHVTQEKLADILDYCIELNLFKKDGEKFFSQGMKDRVEHLQKKSKTLSENGKKGAAKRKKLDSSTTEKEKENNDLKNEVSKSSANAKQMLSKHQIKENKTKLNKTKLDLLKEKVLPAVWNEPRPLKALEDWLEHRKQIKKPITELQLEKLLEKHTLDVENFISCVNHTITQGWIGLRAPEEQPLGGKSPYPIGKQTNFERNMSVLEASQQRTLAALEAKNG